MTVFSKVAPENFAIFQAKRRRSGRPIAGDVLFELTFRCNLRCIHCYLESTINEPPPDELSTSEVTDILDQLFEAGTLAVTFSGGEPLCRPDIFEILEYTRERGLFFGLKTNGTLVTETVADSLKELGITGAHISLYGATPETHEMVTTITGSYARTIRAIKLLRERNIRVAIKTSIMKCNIGELKELEELAQKLGVSFSPDPMVFSKSGQPGSSASLRLDEDQLRAFIIERNWVPDDTQTMMGDLKSRLICSAAKTRCAITAQGEVFPCGVWRMSLGNLRQHSFDEIWQGEVASGIRALNVSDMGICAECNLVRYCAHCLGLVYAENGGVSGPSSESCRLARALKGVRDDVRDEESLH